MVPVKMASLCGHKCNRLLYERVIVLVSEKKVVSLGVHSSYSLVQKCGMAVVDQVASDAEQMSSISWLVWGEGDKWE